MYKQTAVKVCRTLHLDLQDSVHMAEILFKYEHYLYILGIGMVK